MILQLPCARGFVVHSLFRRFSSVADRYAALLASRVIVDDPSQRVALDPLDASLRGLRAFVRARASARARLQVSAAQPGAPPPSLSPAPTAAAAEEERSPFAPPEDVAEVGSLPRGVYLHGDVGTGKSMLMDLFYVAACEAPALRVRRVHFHAFMLEVQQRLHAARAAAAPTHRFRGHVDLRPGRDAAARVGAALAREVDVLCLDELQVTDVADALVVARLFRALLAGGAALVATSNRRPADLYEGGLNREHFLPFIELLQRHTAVVAVEGVADHRVRLGGGGAGAAFSWPCGPAADAALCNAAGWPPPGAAGCPVGGGGAPVAVLPVALGRELRIREPSPGRFLADFGELCGAPLGAADYGALAARCGVLALRGVPALTPARADEARRFVTLVDELYEARVLLLLTADAPLERLFPDGGAAGWGGARDAEAGGGGRDALVPSAAAEGAALRELFFASRRCVSRLVEMRGSAWAEKRRS
jgi:predicted ATPase